MDIVLNKLYEIKEKPGAYLGQKSLSFLYFYLQGYGNREYEYEKSFKGILPGFQEFIQNRYKITSSQDWASIIKFYSVTEEKAFNKFYELLEEFLKEQKNK